MLRINARKLVATALALIAPFVARMAFADSPAQMVAEAQKTIAVFQKADPSLDAFFRTAAGYAVFPTVTKGGLGVGAAHGTGVLISRGKALGKVSLSQVTVGAQAGGQEYSQVIFFETPEALAAFERGQTTFAAQASAVAVQSGAAAHAKYTNGVAVFTATKGGLMAEASIGGQKFKFEPFYPVQ